MDIDYKLHAPDVSNQVNIMKLETFSYMKDNIQFTNFLQENAYFQYNLNEAMENFTTFYEAHDETGIINVFEAILNNFPFNALNKTNFRNGVIDIFKHHEFHKKIIDLLQYEEWNSRNDSITILLILINCEDEEILSYLIDNNLIQIINSCIIADENTTLTSLLCLGNLINATGDQYQQLICDIINFSDIEPYLHKEKETLFCSLFVLRNIIHYFQYIPDPENLVKLLIDLISPQLIPEFVISCVSICFIEMVRVDRTVLNFIFNDPNVFIKFYQAYIFDKEFIGLKTKKEILLLFVTINRALNALYNENPDSNQIFYEMKKKLFDDTFNSFKAIKVILDIDNISEQEQSRCLKMILELLSNSIIIDEKFQSNLKYVYKVVQFALNLMDSKKDPSFKCKNASIKLLLSFIDVFARDLDVLRNMRDLGIARYLVDFLSYDGNIQLYTLNSILIIVHAFQSTVESEKVKDEFIWCNLDKALDEIADDENEDLKILAKMARDEIFGQEE